MEKEKLCIAEKRSVAELLAFDDEYPVGIGEPLYGMRVTQVRFVGDLILDSRNIRWLKQELFGRMAPKKDENG